MRQEAPNAADVSINYEQETLENKASFDLEYAASKDAQSWTTIRQGGTVRLTTMLDNINESDGSVLFYIRKKASSSMSASEAVLVADLQRQAIPEESNKPNIDYRREEISISSSLQYVIVNGTNTSPNWTSAKRAMDQEFRLQTSFLLIMRVRFIIGMLQATQIRNLPENPKVSRFLQERQHRLQ